MSFGHWSGDRRAMGDDAVDVPRVAVPAGPADETALQQAVDKLAKQLAGCEAAARAVLVFLYATGAPPPRTSPLWTRLADAVGGPAPADDTAGEQVGRALTVLRGALGLHYDDVAARVGISTQRLGAMETGAEPEITPEQIRPILAVLAGLATDADAIAPRCAHGVPADQRCSDCTPADDTAAPRELSDTIRGCANAVVGAWADWDGDQDRTEHLAEAINILRLELAAGQSARGTDGGAE